MARLVQLCGCAIVDQMRGGRGRARLHLGCSKIKTNKKRFVRSSYYSQYVFILPFERVLLKVGSNQRFEAFLGYLPFSLPSPLFSSTLNRLSSKYSSSSSSSDAVVTSCRPCSLPRRCCLGRFSSLTSRLSSPLSPFSIDRLTGETGEGGREGEETVSLGAAWAALVEVAAPTGEAACEEWEEGEEELDDDDEVWGRGVT